ncbi:biopolymer transporter ExbD [bacterium]|nr:biopolymer transporter ExbD [bacterium]MBU1073975.1 biopolymer transporter ExbD [bacterium]
MKRRSAYRSLSEINITSLVDVTLCLLIIFMLTAPYIQGGVEVNLPRTETREVVVEEGPIVTVTKNREIYFDEDPVDMDGLADRLSAFLDRRDELPVYLRADAEVPYGFALQVMAAIERLGFSNLSLVADQELAQAALP